MDLVLHTHSVFICVLCHITLWIPFTIYAVTTCTPYRVPWTPSHCVFLFPWIGILTCMCIHVWHMPVTSLTFAQLYTLLPPPTFLYCLVLYPFFCGPFSSVYCVWFCVFCLVLFLPGSFSVSSALGSFLFVDSASLTFCCGSQWILYIGSVLPLLWTTHSCSASYPHMITWIACLLPLLLYLAFLPHSLTLHMNPLFSLPSYLLSSLNWLPFVIPYIALQPSGAMPGIRYVFWFWVLPYRCDAYLDWLWFYLQIRFFPLRLVYTLRFPRVCCGAMQCLDCDASAWWWLLCCTLLWYIVMTLYDWHLMLNYIVSDIILHYIDHTPRYWPRHWGKNFLNWTLNCSCLVIHVWITWILCMWCHYVLYIGIHYVTFIVLCLVLVPVPLPLLFLLPSCYHSYYTTFTLFIVPLEAILIYDILIDYSILDSLFWPFSIILSSMIPWWNRQWLICCWKNCCVLPDSTIQYPCILIPDLHL